MHHASHKAAKPRGIWPFNLAGTKTNIAYDSYCFHAELLCSCLLSSQVSMMRHRT